MEKQPPSVGTLVNNFAQTLRTLRALALKGGEENLGAIRKDAQSLAETLMAIHPEIQNDRYIYGLYVKDLLDEYQDIVTKGKYMGGTTLPSPLDITSPVFEERKAEAQELLLPSFSMWISFATSAYKGQKIKDALMYFERAAIRSGRVSGLRRELQADPQLHQILTGYLDQYKETQEMLLKGKGKTSRQTKNFGGKLKSNVYIYLYIAVFIASAVFLVVFLKA